MPNLRAWLAIGCALFLGCTDSSAPPVSAGTYALATIGGARLPVTTPWMIVTTGVLELDSGGRWGILLDSGAGGLVPSCGPFQGTWTQRGSHLELRFDYRPSTDLTVAIVDDGGRTIRVTFASDCGDSREYEFRRT